MLPIALLVLSGVGAGHPAPPRPRVVRTERSPIWGKDPVRVARFDSMNTVASQREALKVGAERTRAQSELAKAYRSSVALGASVQAGYTRQEVFPQSAK